MSKDAREPCYETYLKIVEGQIILFVKTRLPEWADWEGIVQEAAIQVCKSWDSVQKTRGALTAAIVRSKCNDWYRKEYKTRKANPTVDIDLVSNELTSALDPPETGLIAAEFRAAVLELVRRRFGAKYVKVCQLDMDGMTLEETATALEVAVNTIGPIRHRIKTHLRNTLEQE